MPEGILSSNVIELVESCIRKAALASQADHHGLAGEIREIVLSNLLKPLLPQGFNIGTGKIIDRKGALSHQTDIIVYNSSRFPPIMFDKNKGVFPIDSVYYTIEVKSTVNATALRDSVEKAKLLRSLSGQQPHFVLFGFKTDMTTPGADLERVSKYQSDFEKPPLNIYCNVGQGYCYYNDLKWDTFPDCERHAEVIGLIIGIVNTLVNAGIKAKDTNPGAYLAWWT